jgi:hypothetical protein
MAQQNDKNDQEGAENDNFGEDIKKNFSYNFDAEEQEDNTTPVTKIYVAGNEYNSVDEIPPDVRDKMSETLIQVQQESSKAEDLSVVFKKQRKLRNGVLLFGDRADSYSKPTPDLGKMALLILAVVVVAVIIYIMIVK